MSKVKMVLDLDFDKLQCVKSEILNLHLNEEDKKPLDFVVNLIDMIQDQSVDHPDNKFTHKQVYGP